MKFLDEYRDKAIISALADNIAASTTGRWNIMEICGGQTHTILKYSLEKLLPEGITMIHGPGCPVCVTSLEKIDMALDLARNGIILTTFGDMLRVPGSNGNLLAAKAEGADVRMVYSPLDALTIAASEKDKQLVFLAVGFETTAPSIARTILLARDRKLENFSVISAHVLVPPAIEFLLSSPLIQIDALLAAGHVCTVMGYHEYLYISERYHIPIVVTGFEPADILNGILSACRQLDTGTYIVENQYSRAVTHTGNRQAQDLISRVFEVEDRDWRGIGIIPLSGLKIREEFSPFDALKKFPYNFVSEIPANSCIAGEILQGIKKPSDCPEFNKSCTAAHPLGAPMVSSEGACAAYYHYSEKEI